MADQTGKGNNGTINPVKQTLEDGLSAHYLFDSNPQDTSGHNLHGTVYGATLTNDRFGNSESAYQFDGVDDYIEVPHNDLLNLTDHFTISLWLKQDAAHTPGYRLVDKTTAGVNDGYNFDTYDGSTGRKLRLTGGVQNASATTVYSLNEWHHVAVVFSKGVSSFYLDGVPDGSGNHGSSIKTNSLTLRIGTSHGSNNEFFKGALDDIRIYNRALSEAEIKEIHQLPSSKETSVTPQVEITHIFYKGQVKKTQADEYVEITNQGNAAADVSGWQIASGVGRNKMFAFPAGTTLAAGQSVRVYTNEVHPESGGFSCNSGVSLWKDSGDEAKLLDAQGNVVSGLAYDSKGNFTKTKTASENTSATFETVKAEFNVSNLKVNITAADIEAQMTPQTKVSCVDAFRKALKSLIEDGTNEFSPVAEVKEYPDIFGLGDGEVDAQTASQKVREALNSKRSISLWRKEEIPADVEDPEDYYNAFDEQVKLNCENLNVNPSECWIFQLNGFISYGFAAVDKAGVKPTVNWGIHPDYIS